MNTPMKPLRLLSLFLQACTSLVFLGLIASAQGTSSTNGLALGKTNAVASASATNAVGAVTNLGPVEVPIPTAVFDLAAKPTKDPFFPLSLRQPVQIATNATPTFSAAVFNLKGLSGSPGHRLALINNRTVAAGEDAEITTSAGKVKIQCVEIKESSVIIRAESQTDPLEVFLRKSAQ
jgi:hypothetical protein